MYIDKSFFYDYEVAAYCFNVSYVLVVASMYWFADKVSPTWTLLWLIEGALKNYLAILIVSKTAFAKIFRRANLFGLFYFRYFKNC
jgi:hypothetical protein